MARIAEGRYEGRLIEGEHAVTLRVSRCDDGTLSNVSGDIFSPTGHMLSFVGIDTSLAETADDRISGRLSYFSEGVLARTGSRFALERRSVVDDAIVMLTVKLDADDIDVSLTWVGKELRTLQVDVDGLASLPTPQPGIFTGDPAGKDLVSALKRASIAATVNVRPFRPYAENTPDPQRLSIAELHSWMEAQNPPPTSVDRAWRLHVLFAGQFSGRGEGDVSGIMYDVEPQRRPARQGLAVFLNSKAIANCLPINGDAWRREVLFTLVHEIGHVLNLPHAFEDNRAQALTWMNYPERMQAGPAGFWASFKDVFDDPELAFLHHAPFPDIAPGQNDYSQRRSSFLSGGSGIPMFLSRSRPRTATPATVKATLSVVPLKSIYVFGEPVFLKVSVANNGRKPLSVAKALDPSDGFTAIRVTTPSGKLRTLRPPTTLCQNSPRVSLTYRKTLSFDGVLASFDVNGAIFDEPGRYRIEATFTGIDGAVLDSAPSYLRVLYPTREEELFAISIWDDRPLMRAIYCRQPLLALESWRRLMNEKIRLLAQDKDNTTAAYLRYVAALGWMSPFSPAARPVSYSPDPAKAAALLRTVKPQGLPQGVARRYRELVRRKK